MGTAVEDSSFAPLQLASLGIGFVRNCGLEDGTQEHHSFRSVVEHLVGHARFFQRILASLSNNLDYLESSSTP